MFTPMNRKGLPSRVNWVPDVETKDCESPGIDAENWASRVLLAGKAVALPQLTSTTDNTAHAIHDAHWRGEQARRR